MMMLGPPITWRMEWFFPETTVGMAAVMLFSFALIPGMPKVSFLLVSGCAGWMAYSLFRRSAKSRETVEEAPAPVAAAEPPDLLSPLDLLGVEVGYGLIPLVDTTQGGELLQRIKSLRKQIGLEMGFIIPAIHIRDNLNLKPNEYTVLMKGIELARGELMTGHSLAITSDDRPGKLKGIETKEPAFGLPAVWIPERDKEMAQAKGYVVVDPATVITTHLTEVVKTHADEILGRQEVQALLDNLAATQPKLVEELVPKVVPIGVLQKVLQRLLRERVSIRDLSSIVETLSDYVGMTKNVDILTGYVRQSLSRTITRQYQDAGGNITVIMMSPEIEETISGSIQHMEYESFASPDPNMVKRLVAGLQKFVSSFAAKGLQPILLCSPNVRIHLRKILEKFFPNLVVISHNEVTREALIKSLGVVEI